MSELDLDTLEACWAAIHKNIAHGDLAGDGTCRVSERNGMILATNILARMIDDASPEKIKLRDDFFINPPMELDQLMPELLHRLELLEARVEALRIAGG